MISLFIYNLKIRYANWKTRNEPLNILIRTRKWTYGVRPIRKPTR